MKATVRPISRFSSPSRVRICACVDTSRPETISSASTKFGLSATRARCRRAGAGRPRARADSGSQEPRREADALDASAAPVARPRRPAQAVVQQQAGRAKIGAIVRRGLSEDSGSWKIICSVAAERPQRLLVEVRDVAAVEAERAGGRLEQAAPACGRASTCPSPIRRRCRRRVALAMSKSRPCRISRHRRRGRTAACASGRAARAPARTRNSGSAIGRPPDRVGGGDLGRAGRRARRRAPDAARRPAGRSAASRRAARAYRDGAARRRQRRGAGLLHHRPP